MGTHHLGAEPGPQPPPGGVAAAEEGAADEALCPAPRHHEPVAGQPVWCRPCAERIGSALARLPHLAAQLALRGYTHAGKLAAGPESDPTRSAARSGSPSGSPAWDAADELISWAGVTESRLREHLAHSRALRTVEYGGTARRVMDLGASVRYLSRWLTALLASPMAEEVGRRVLELERRAERAAGLDRLVHRLAAPCPSCDLLALVREDGADQVECRGCGRVWTEDDYRRLVLVLASDVRDVQRAGRP